MLSELENYLVRIEDLRGQVIDLISDLPPEALNWRPVEGDDDHATNSLAVMATHLVGAEHFWIAQVIGRRPSTRDREAEFDVTANNAAELTQLLENAAATTRDILSGLSEADLNDIRDLENRTVPVRWALVHVVDHTALHLGHMQITYQLWHDGRGVTAPRWFQRLPGDGD